MIHRVAAIVALSLAVTFGEARDTAAAVTTFYTDLASFSAAAGAPLVLQDFSAFAPGANLSGVEFLPGISTTTNMTTLTEFVGAMFGAGGRELGNARYDTQFALPYTAVSFEITSFEADPNNASKAQDPGTLTVFYSDATSESRPISGNLLGDPVFVGLISNTTVTSIRWAEAHEGSGGNEETGLDNFRVVRAVPEPCSAGSGLLGLTFLAIGRRLRRCT